MEQCCSMLDDFCILALFVSLCPAPALSNLCACVWFCLQVNADGGIWKHAHYPHPTIDKDYSSGAHCEDCPLHQGPQVFGASAGNGFPPSFELARGTSFHERPHIIWGSARVLVSRPRAPKPLLTGRSREVHSIFCTMKVLLWSVLLLVMIM